jgi:hypothetical protein
MPIRTKSPPPFPRFTKGVLQGVGWVGCLFLNKCCGHLPGAIFLEAVPEHHGAKLTSVVLGCLVDSCAPGPVGLAGLAMRASAAPVAPTFCLTSGCTVLRLLQVIPTVGVGGEDAERSAAKMVRFFSHLVGASLPSYSRAYERKA